MKNNFLYGLALYLILSAPVLAQEESNPAVLYNNGIDFYEQEKYDESIASFKKAIILDPEFYEAYYNLARVQETAGKLDDAIKSYEKVIELVPDDYESIYQYCEVLYRSGYLTKALLHLKKIPQDSEYRPKADILVGKIDERQKELQSEALVKSEQALKSSVIGNLPAPSGVVVNSDGDIFVASFSDNKIIKFSKTTGEKTVFADKSKGVDGPIGLEIDSKDNIYVSNYTKGNVIVFNKDGDGRILLYAKKPYGLHVDPNKNRIYVTEQGNNSVIQYDISDVLGTGEPIIDTEITKTGESKTITMPKNDDVPIGTPSIIESNYTKQNPSTSITAPIMIPATSAY